MGNLEVFRNKAETILDSGVIPKGDKRFWYCEFDENPQYIHCFVERYEGNVSFLPYSTANLKRREREKRYVFAVLQDLRARA